MPIRGATADLQLPRAKSTSSRLRCSTLHAAAAEKEDMTPRTGPFTKLRVLDLGTNFAVSMIGAHVGDLGAVNFLT